MGVGMWDKDAGMGNGSWDVGWVYELWDGGMGRGYGMGVWICDKELGCMGKEFLRNGR